MATSRLHILFFVFTFWAVVLIGRLFMLQVRDYGTFAAFARGQQQVVEVLAPERGSILGRNLDGSSTVYATNRDWSFVYAVPQQIEDLEKVAGILKDILGIDEEEVFELTERLSNRDDPYEPIAEKITDEQATRIREAALLGVRLGEARGRFYPNGSRLSHVLGFIGHRDDGTRRGTYGLESFFEDELRGVEGKFQGERDAKGTVLSVFSKQALAPEPGARVVTTIDANIQYQTEKFLREMVTAWKATGGTAIVMDPHTGAIFALANEPAFDPNAYGGVSDLSVFTNAAVAQAYEPGSVFKAVTMAAALDSGAIVPETVYENTGSVRIGSYTISNTLQQYNGTKSMVDVLRYSLNTGAVFAEAKTGHEKFRSYVEAFGFGAPSGITLPNEAFGSVENLRSGRQINFVTASFGQGISVTPLQLIRAFAAIANGGTLVRPYIVSAIERPNGAREETTPDTGKRVIAQRTATRLAAMLTRVIEDGSGVRAKLPGYTIAGKTGTAEIPNVGSPGYGEENIHSFVAFFPAFDPKFVILTKVDRPQGARYAESTAVPLFKQIAEYLITYAAIPPDRPSH